MTRIGLISYLEYACKFIHQWHTHTDNPYRKAMALIVISMSIFIASVFARSIFIQWINHRIYDPCLCILYKPLIDFQFECHCPGWKEKWNIGSCNVQWISSTVYFFSFFPHFYVTRYFSSMRFCCACFFYLWSYIFEVVQFKSSAFHFMDFKFIVKNFCFYFNDIFSRNILVSL